MSVQGQHGFHYLNYTRKTLKFFLSPLSSTNKIYAQKKKNAEKGLKIDMFIMNQQRMASIKKFENILGYN